MRTFGSLDSDVAAGRPRLLNDIDHVLHALRLAESFGLEAERLAPVFKCVVIAAFHRVSISNNRTSWSNDGYRQNVSKKGSGLIRYSGSPGTEGWRKAPGW